MTRKERSTEQATLAKRKSIWTDAVKTAEKHKRMGEDLQTQGVSFIDAIDNAEVNLEQATKIVQQWSTVIQKGITIEREAADKLIQLHDHVPK